MAGRSPSDVTLSHVGLGSPIARGHPATRAPILTTNGTVAYARERGGELPQFVREAFEAYLRCGRLEHG